MQTVEISARAEGQEHRALEAYLRNRNLILAQAVEDLKAQLAAAQAEVRALKTHDLSGGDVIVDQERAD